MDRVTNIAWKTTSGTILGGFAYEYDAVGRIVSRSHVINGQAQHKSYSYDDLDRLASDDGVTYTYDAAGNRTTIDNTKARESCWESFASRICDGRRGYNSGESEGLG